MKWKNILLVLALWVVAGACEKKEIPMFTTDDELYLREYDGELRGFSCLFIRVGSGHG